MKNWKRLWEEFPAAFIVAVSAITVGLCLASKAQGRREAIERYRQECIGSDKSAHRDEFTLLYVDEYRASNCEEAIRLIWGP